VDGYADSCDAWYGALTGGRADQADWPTGLADMSDWPAGGLADQPDSPTMTFGHTDCGVGWYGALTGAAACRT